jgi:hypothetical protein
MAGCLATASEVNTRRTKAAERTQASYEAVLGKELESRKLIKYRGSVETFDQYHQLVEMSPAPAGISLVALDGGDGTKRLGLRQVVGGGCSGGAAASPRSRRRQVATSSS